MAQKTLDPRIGRRGEDKIEWPTVDVAGQPYTRPRSTLDLAGDHFCVLDDEGRGKPEVINELLGILDKAVPAPEADKPAGKTGKGTKTDEVADV